MTDFPTTNRIPFGLLTPEEQAILKEWPHGWQMLDLDGWSDRAHPTWSLHIAYRGKPAPAKVAYQELNRVYTHAEVQHLLENRPTWEQWREILAAGYAQKARADRLEAALQKIAGMDLMCESAIAFNALRAERTPPAALKGDER